eukprot:GHRR01015379.1.p1 GENE.GHRR01015379.1~~GHRR01015379.1.p1  ORF type:complete len:276 (+),score=103.63 GHRR01015379.1:522-1349(+)
MARFLSWEHLRSQQIAALRQAASSAAGPSARQLLKQIVPDQLGENLLRNDIILDLYAYALRQGQAWDFDDERISCLFAIVKEVHTASIRHRLTIERSFAFFKDTLINHSIQRPPFSVGVFSQDQMRSILDWMLDTYFRHYKLYQYAFTNRVTMSISTYHPSSLVQLVPKLPPLAEALTEEQRQQQLDEQQRQLEEQQRAEAAATAAAAEEARARAVAEEYEASLPEDIKDKVSLALEREVAYLKKKMEEQFQHQQAELLAKLAQLEAGQTGSPPT